MTTTEKCYICEYPKHAPTNTHTFTTVAEAESWFQDDTPAYNQESAYVAEHRPY